MAKTKNQKTNKENRGGKIKDQKNKLSLGPFEKQFSKTCGWSKQITESKDCMKKEQNFNSAAWKASTPVI